MKKQEKIFGERYLSDEAFDLFDDAYELFSQELSESFLEENDVIEIILEVFGAQESRNNFDNAIKFTNLLRSKQPALYKEAFVYLGDMIVEYYCFKGKSKEAKVLFDDYKANPLKDIDKYLLVFRSAVYYGLTNVVEQFVTENYKEILTSDKVMSNTALELAKIKLYLIFEEAYNNRENGIDKAVLAEQLSAYGFTAVDSIINGLEEAISQTGISTTFNSCMTEMEQSLSLFYLEMHFLQWMAKKGFPFYISGSIWGNILEYWSETNEDVNTLAEFVVLNFESYKSHIDDLSSFNYNDNTAEGAAALWGSVYIYDFFLEMGILSSEVHAKYCGYIQKAKGQFIGNSTYRTWIANFVHEWEKPNSVSDKEYAVEKKLFEKSYSISEYRFFDVGPQVADELEELGEFGAEIIKAGEQSDQVFDEIANLSMEKLLSLDGAQSSFENERTLFDDMPFTPALEKKVGRNEPCPCDSGKKYKKCCGKN